MKEWQREPSGNRVMEETLYHQSCWTYQRIKCLTEWWNGCWGVCVCGWPGIGKRLSKNCGAFRDRCKVEPWNRSFRLCKQLPLSCVCVCVSLAASPNSMCENRLMTTVCALMHMSAHRYLYGCVWWLSGHCWGCACVWAQSTLSGQTNGGILGVWSHPTLCHYASP